MKIKTSALTGAALDWAASMASGRAMRRPRRADSGDLASFPLPFTMYEVVIIHRVSRGMGGQEIAAEVRPIKVTRLDNEKAGGHSIAFVGSDGHEALGRLDQFYLDRAEAELEAVGAVHGYADDFHPSTTPTDHHSIVRAAGISVAEWIGSGQPPNGERWYAVIAPAANSDTQQEVMMSGSDSKIAAARCLVASRLGAEVDVPEEVLTMAPEDEEGQAVDWPRERAA